MSFPAQCFGRLRCRIFEIRLPIFVPPHPLRRLIIDWHNFAYSLLALSLQPCHLGASSPDSPSPLPVSMRALLWAAERYERVCGRWGHHHVTVCHAMAEELKSHWVSKGRGKGVSCSCV